MDDMVKEAVWSNTNNNAFYASVKAEGLRELAEKGGLSTGCDLCLLTPYWSEAQSILEVGAGYGRAINYLLKHKFQGKITAIERCNSQFEYLKEQFNSYKNVYLLHADIRFFSSFNENFDLILFLWAGICDFSLTEQSLLIKKLASLLKNQGKLLIDTVPSDVVPLGSKKLGKCDYSLQINDSTLRAHVPNIHEMKSHAKEGGFMNTTYITYQTDIGRRRLIHILS